MKIRDKSGAGFSAMLEELAQEPLERVLEKVPEWRGAGGLKVPAKINAEQCSSSATARYKAALAQRIASAAGAGVSADGPAAGSAGAYFSPAERHGANSSVRPSGKPRIADLTGGLGVDSFFLAGIASELLYIERNPELCKAVALNFNMLGTNNIRILNSSCGPDAVTEALLKDYAPDLIFLDPARRSSAGRKVFLLEDCEPDLTAMLPMLLGCAPAVMVKVSPMADISLLKKRLGAPLKEVHIVQHKGELKELLLLLSNGPEEASGLRLTVAMADLNNSLTFNADDESASSIAFASESELTEGSIIFEPGPALAKSGAFRLLCSRFNLRTLSSASHLYTGKVPDELKPFGKSRAIIKVLPFGKAAIKELGSPAAEISAKGIPMTSEELRKRLGCPSGGNLHIFGVTLHPDHRRLILCSTA